MPTCAKCGYNIFVTLPVALVGAGEGAKLVCCGNCYTVVGVLDSEETNNKLERVIAALRIIAGKLGLPLSL